LHVVENDREAYRVWIACGGNPSGNVIKVGWSAGLGSEWMFAPGWSTKIEYLHADLGTETFSSGGFFAFSVTGHLTEDVVRLGLNYKFGW
jgi:opacity protein-like surface antigen